MGYSGGFRNLKPCLQQVSSPLKLAAYRSINSIVYIELSTATIWSELSPQEKTSNGSFQFVMFFFYIVANLWQKYLLSHEH